MDAVGDLSAHVLSWVFYVVANFVQPVKATCPPGWWVNGVRLDGTFQCYKPWPGDEEHPPAVDVFVSSRLYCGVQRPAVVNERMVACRRDLP